jgi:glucan phosphoethanolaminetransferase (alkaline phosphatase superfamily)
MNLLAMILQNTSDTSAAEQMILMMFPIIGAICLVGLAIILIPFWFICKKAGFSPWLTLLNIIPLGNLVLLYVLAFADWKVVPVQQLVPMQPPYPPPYTPVPPQFPPTA